MNESAIKQWISTPGDSALTVNFSPTEPGIPIGIRVTGRTGELETVAGTRVFLVRDSTMAAGVRILSAYPIP